MEWMRKSETSSAWKRRERRRLGLLLAALLVAAAGWRLDPIKAGITVGRSMEPNFTDGQVFLLDQGYYRKHAPRKGDVVVVQVDGTTVLKRIYAAGGETVRLLRVRGFDGMLIPLAEGESGITQVDPRLGQLVEVRVPPGEVFLLGDALGNSVDSREFGPVAVARIRGRVIVAKLFTLRRERQEEKPPDAPQGEMRAGSWVAAGL